MPKGIKTKTTIKDIKLLDKTANLDAHAKNAFVRSKQGAEAMQEPQHHSPGDYATDNVTSYAKDTAQEAAHRAKDAVKHPPHKKARDSLTRANEHFHDAKSHLPKQRKDTAAQAKQAADNAKKTATTLKGKAGQAQKTAEQTKKVVADAKRTLQQTRQAGRNNVKSAKGTGEGSIKTAKKSVKTAEKSTRMSVKTAKQTAKTAQKSAQATAKAAKSAAQSSKAAAKTAAKTAKAATKAVIATVKATIAAAKGVGAAIVAGGWVAMVIILVICMVGMLVGSTYGIFFSGQKSKSGHTMPAVISELSADFYAKADEIQKDNPHDEVEMGTMAIQWDKVLAVYAVKTDEDEEVATLDDKKVEKLRKILNDMLSLKHSTSTAEREKITEDGNGNEFTETVKIKILHISLEQKSADDMASKYSFSKKKKEQLQELLLPDFANLWAQLLGGYVFGNGEIIQTKSKYTPKDIFSWPLENDFPISSLFGYRADPFTGELKFHSGLDIAAPEGTPLLAMADGVVSASNSVDTWGNGWGFFVRIKHEGGYETLYAHCSKIAVVSGQEVKKGEVIGYVGSTGRSSGPHLHVEIYKDGIRINPMDFFE